MVQQVPQDGRVFFRIAGDRFQEEWIQAPVQLWLLARQMAQMT